MPADNKLELVVEVDADKANASIKSVSTGLSSVGQAAVHATKGASAGIDGMTASTVKACHRRQSLGREHQGDCDLKPRRSA